MRNWKAGRQEIIDAENGDSIGATFVTLRGKKAVEDARREAQENAVLMAAAPRLLAALESLYEATRFVSIGEYSEEVHDIALSSAFDAICEAKGIGVKDET